MSLPMPTLPTDASQKPPDEFLRLSLLAERLLTKLAAVATGVRTPGSVRRSCVECAETLLADLAKQNGEMVLVPERDWEIAKALPADLRRRADEAEATLNAIAYYLRHNYGREIAQGRHDGKTLAEIVIGYLAQAPHSGESIEGGLAQ